MASIMTIQNGMQRGVAKINAKQIVFQPNERVDVHCLNDVLTQLYDRIEKLENDFIEYILLTQNNQGVTCEHCIRNTEQKDSMVSIDDGKVRE